MQKRGGKNLCARVLARKYVVLLLLLSSPLCEISYYHTTRPPRFLITQLKRTRTSTCKFSNPSILFFHVNEDLICRNKTVLVLCLIAILVLDSVHAAPRRRSKSKYKCNNGRCVPRKHDSGEEPAEKGDDGRLKRAASIFDSNFTQGFVSSRKWGRPIFEITTNWKR